MVYIRYSFSDIIVMSFIQNNYVYFVQIFSKEKLGNVLMKLCESSVALLNEQKDPWGNITTE